MSYVTFGWLARDDDFLSILVSVTKTALKSASLATFRCKIDGCSIVSCARDHGRSAGMIGGAGEGMLVVRMA